MNPNLPSQNVCQPNSFKTHVCYVTVNILFQYAFKNKKIKDTVWDPDKDIYLYGGALYFMLSCGRDGVPFHNFKIFGFSKGLGKFRIYNFYFFRRSFQREVRIRPETR